MKLQNETENLSLLHDLLEKYGLISSGSKGVAVTALAGDGSSRKFWRIRVDGKKCCLAVAPPDAERSSIREAQATHAIGIHLHKKKCPVPEQYGWDADSGTVLFEDFGDCKLHDFVLNTREQGGANEQILHQYKEVLTALVHMQVRGADGFQATWCWDTPQYETALMRERESGYFYRAFWQDLLGQSDIPGLAEEFASLAQRAGEVPAHFFLHRDFQSRNIMLHDNGIGIIDFQGGRFGPLAYDLASLLLDPYVGLGDALKEELWDFYVELVEAKGLAGRKQFATQYQLLALHRNLQIIGAFAFLSQQRGKPFFRQFLRPAIALLLELVQQPLFQDYPLPKNCVQRCGQELRK